MRLALQLLSFVVAFAFLWWLGSPHEMRHSRGTKMLLSTPLLAGLVWFIPQGLSRGGGYIIIFSILCLALIWASNISWMAAGGVISILDSQPTSATGFHPEYRFAKNHRRDGEYEEAIKATLHELEKDPRNFEGLMLLAGIYQDTNLPKTAMIHLDVILNNPDASESQKEVARAERAKCESQERHLAAMAVGKKK